MADFDLIGARIWTGTGAGVIENGYVSVRAGLITAVGAGVPPNSGDGPSSVPVVSADGATLIPGLTDAHVHLTTASRHRTPVDNATYRALVSNPEKLLNGVRNGLRALAAGFTTLRVMGHRDVGEPQLRDFIDEGLLVGPRMLVAPWVVSMTGGRGDLFWPATVDRDPLDTADGVDECRKMVRLQRKQGADFIKVTASGGMLSGGDRPHWPNYTQAELTAIAEEAHDYELRVAAHAHSVEGVKRSVLAGIDTIEHGAFIDDECIELMVEHGTYLVPTLAITEWVYERGRSGSVTEDALAKIQDARHRHHENFLRAYRAGVKVAMGTDSTGTICPFGEHARELELYVAAGLTPEQALTTATRTAAEALGVEEEQGTIEPGKAADLVLVDGDPLADIGLLRGGGIAAVYRRGIDVTDPWSQVTAVMRAEPAFFRP